MALAFADRDAVSAARPLHLVRSEDLDRLLDDLGPAWKTWCEAARFKAGFGAHILLPGQDGAPAAAIVGLGDAKARSRSRFALGTVARKLSGVWRIEGAHDPDALEEAALGWLLGSYSFTRYTSPAGEPARLVAPDGIDAESRLAIAEGEVLTRDLINTPASDMGPADLQDAVGELSSRHGAEVTTICGAELTRANLPLIAAVGRAAAGGREPRLIDLRWGSEGPALTLVGKGVCFDTGGLNLKPGGSMALMKKDMGGAATVLGLAHMIMAARLRSGSGC